MRKVYRSVIQRKRIAEKQPSMILFLRSLLIVPFLSLLVSGMAQAQFSFVVAADQRGYAGAGIYDTSAYFRGVVEAIRRTGAGAFLLSPGDIDPPGSSDWTIAQVMGDDYQWLPVVGNHELPGEGRENSTGENMAWLRSFDVDINGPGTDPTLINHGPPGCPQTTYSFAFQDAHFIVLNEYCDVDGDAATKGDLPDHLYDWLSSDLSSTAKKHIFVVGHEPAYPQPDADNGRFRHRSDSLNAYPDHRNRLWELLQEHGVVAYFNGHTHNFSAVRLDSVWQIDSGHSRGRGDEGAPSTYTRVDVGENISFTTFRDTHDGVYEYTDILHRGVLSGLPDVRQRSFQADDKGGRSRDTTLSQHAQEKNYGHGSLLYADGDDPPGSGKDLAALMYWDISSIPPGSTVTSVHITLEIVNPSEDKYHLHALALPWSESTSDWRNADDWTLWQLPGALGSADASDDFLAYFSPSRKGRFTFFLNEQGRRFVQEWIDTPSANHGVLLHNPSVADGVDFYSSEVLEPEMRPKLTISYTITPAVEHVRKALPWLHLLRKDGQ